MLYKKVEKYSTLSPKKPKVEYLSPDLDKNQLKVEFYFLIPLKDDKHSTFRCF